MASHTWDDKDSLCRDTPLKYVL
ncbi:MAG: hypothetical protein ACD_23C00401G0001, partial [uncultured bacterium]